MKAFFFGRASASDCFFRMIGKYHFGELSEIGAERPYLDHLFIFGEAHPHHAVSAYVTSSNRYRPHR
jgi:hypothetical protein